jgi:hypothetical protein
MKTVQLKHEPIYSVDLMSNIAIVNSIQPILLRLIDYVGTFFKEQVGYIPPSPLLNYA